MNEVNIFTRTEKNVKQSKDYLVYINHECPVNTVAKIIIINMWLLDISRYMCLDYIKLTEGARL